MADIKIRRSGRAGRYNTETSVEVLGADYINEELIKNVLDKMRPIEALLMDKGGDREQPEGANHKEAGTQPGIYNFRMVVSEDISPEELKTAVWEGNVDETVSPYDEIDIPIDTGETVTVVCAYSAPTTARFVFKDCLGEGVMNDEATNKGGYYKSKGRKRVLEDIYPHLPEDWKAIIKPRKLVEEIDGERVEYEDLMWLLSATDVFGTPEDCFWKDIDDSFQLPIFKRERERVKECGDEGTYPYWLRSVRASTTYYFCYVYTSGSAGYYYASNSHGFAPGFDI